MPRRSLHDLTWPDLESALVQDGLSAHHARAVWLALYRHPAGLSAENPDLLPPVRRWLDRVAGPGGALEPDAPVETADIASSDGLTRKFLLRLEDGQEIETVVMGYAGRYTACLSTQAGCAMGCVFCATGQMGFVRHLRPGEIVAQVQHVRQRLAAAGLSGLRNLVLMGMGEPLHNYDAVMQAMAIVTDDRGIRLPPGHVSISTVGVVPGILRMAEENPPYSLAISLHGSTDEERGALIPVNRRWPLADVLAAAREYGRKTGKRIFFGWTLIAGKNDSPAHAARIVALLAGIDAHVNLIPLNPTEAYEGGTSGDAAVHAFQRVLREAGLPCTIRQRRGIDVAAGCGQLRAVRRPSVPLLSSPLP